MIHNRVPLLLSRQEIDDDKWNELIEKSGQEIIYAYSWYLDVVCENWKAIVLSSETEYEVVMPLPIKRKFGYHVIQQPLYCQYLGFFYNIKFSTKLLTDFLTLLNASFSFVSCYNFHPANYELLGPFLPGFPGFRIQTRHSHWLNLNRSYEIISKSYSGDRKMNMKQAKEWGWSILSHSDIDPLIRLFKVNHEVQISGGVSLHAYLLLQRLYAVLAERGRADLRYAYSGSTIHAGALIVKSRTSAVYLFNAADYQGRRGNARSLILNQFLQENANQTMIFDFESPEVKTIASFYKSFGSSEAAYFSISRNALPFPLNVLQRMRKFLMLKIRNGG